MGRYENLKEILQERGMSKYRLAKDCNITPSNIYAGFNGRCKFYEGWKVRVAEVLNMEIEEIFGTEGK